MAKVMAFTALVAISLTVAAAVFGAKSQPLPVTSTTDKLSRPASQPSPYPSPFYPTESHDQYPFATEEPHETQTPLGTVKPYPTVAYSPYYEPFPSSTPEPYYEPYPSYNPKHIVSPSDGFGHYPTSVPYTSATASPDVDTGDLGVNNNTVPHVIPEPDVSVTPDFYYEDIHYTHLPHSEGGNDYTAPYVTTAPDASVTPGFYYEDIYYTPLPYSEGGNEYTVPYVTTAPDASVTPGFYYEDIHYTPLPYSEGGNEYTVPYVTTAPDASVTPGFYYEDLYYTPLPSAEGVTDARPIESQTPFPSKHDNGYAPTKTPKTVYTNGVDEDACYLKTFKVERGVGEYCCPEEFSCESENCSNSYECKSSTRKYYAYCRVVKCQQVYLHSASK